MFELKPSQLIKKSNKATFILRFENENALDGYELVTLLQEDLYDKHGTTGHFRIAPKSREHVTERFILSSAKDVEFYEDAANQVHIAFFIEAYDCDVTLGEELAIFAEEMKIFALEKNLQVKYVALNDIYTLSEEEVSHGV